MTAVQFGQFAPVGDLYYAAVLQKGNPLGTCVNVAISSLSTNGTLKALRLAWLKAYNAVPVITP